MAAFYTSPAYRDRAEKARAEARQIARANKITLTTRFDEGWHEILITAPAGQRFEPELHELVIANAGPVTDELWERVLADLKENKPEACDDAACEWCHPEVCE